MKMGNWELGKNWENGTWFRKISAFSLKSQNLASKSIFKTTDSLN